MSRASKTAPLRSRLGKTGMVDEKRYASAMSGDRLALLREQAKSASTEIRAAALLHVARVEAAVDKSRARETLLEGIDAARQIEYGQFGHVLVNQFRNVIAAVAPEHIDDLADLARERSAPFPGLEMESSDLVNAMLQHGHIQAAVDYALTVEIDGFPGNASGRLMASVTDSAVQMALLRRAAEAWRRPQQRPPRMGSEFFVHLFRRYWKILPEDEARALVHEMVGFTRSKPPVRMSARYDPEGTVEITSLIEHTLFTVFDVLRALDPAAADALPADYPQLAAALQRFPLGLASVEAEAEKRRNAAVAQGTQRKGFGFAGGGGLREMQYARSLHESTETGDFDAPFTYAMERYEEDASEVKPNVAPKELWPSTGAFRSVLYRAGKANGRNAAALLERIPDQEVRLLAAIELEAAIHDLPELRHISATQFRPSSPVLAPSPVRLRIEGTAVAEPAVDIPTDLCGPHIRCPKCKWRPRKQDRWACSCGHVWNTFDTGGVCPACIKRWTVTQCLECLVMSPHSDWYETAGL